MIGLVVLDLSESAQRITAGVFADLAPRIEAQMRRGADLIGLHIGDSHRAPPAGVRYGDLEGGPADESELHRYGDVRGLTELKERFAAHLAASGHGPPDTGPENVLVAVGATHALFCAARATLDAGDEVLVAAPYWPLAVGVLRAAGAVPVEVPLSRPLYADPRLDPARLLADAITSKTRAVYFATPNNPDGKVLSAAQIARIADLAARRRLWILADEVYAEYVYGGAHTSIARTPEVADQTLSVYSMSKSRALAGARVGFAVGPPRVIALARRIAMHSVFHPTIAAQRVALAALNAPSTWIDDARDDYRDARDTTIRALSSAGVALDVPEGGSYAFVDFGPSLGRRSPKEFLEQAVDAGVLLAPGDGFGRDFGRFARICFTGVPRPRLREGLSRLIRIL
jgi:aspartate/methionine/tyrosine aminotransferase